MAKKDTVREPRRKLLQDSFHPETGGGFTIHAAKMMAEPLGGKPAECTLTAHCRTFVFDFPRAFLTASEAVAPNVLYNSGGLRASIVSDLPAFFENAPADSLHYSIDVSLPVGIRETYDNALKQHKGKDDRFFLIIEDYVEFVPTVLNTDQCFLIDEVRDGTPVIVGGREGRKTLVAFPALGCPWPDFRPNMNRVNVVLAAVKAVQNVPGHVRQLFDCSTFVSSKRESVATLKLTMSASGQALSPLAPADLEKRAQRIGSMIQEMLSDSNTVASELFDSIVLDKTTDDGYLRLSYLRLWQALEDAKRQLGRPELLNDRSVIAGKRTPTELKEYRNDIAHWYTGRMDQSYLQDLQYTVMELLRRKYSGRLESDGC